VPHSKSEELCKLTDKAEKYKRSAVCIFTLSAQAWHILCEEQPKQSVHPRLLESSQMPSYTQQIPHIQLPEKWSTSQILPPFTGNINPFAPNCAKSVVRVQLQIQLHFKMRLGLNRKTENV